MLYQQTFDYCHVKQIFFLFMFVILCVEVYGLVYLIQSRVFYVPTIKPVTGLALSPLLCPIDLS